MKVLMSYWRMKVKLKIRQTKSEVKLKTIMLSVLAWVVRRCPVLDNHDNTHDINQDREQFPTFSQGSIQNFCWEKSCPNNWEISQRLLLHQCNCYSFYLLLKHKSQLNQFADLCFYRRAFSPAQQVAGTIYRYDRHIPIAPTLTAIHPLLRHRSHPIIVRLRWLRCQQSVFRPLLRQLLQSSFLSSLRNIGLSSVHLYRWCVFETLVPIRSSSIHHLYSWTIIISSYTIMAWFSSSPWETTYVFTKSLKHGWTNIISYHHIMAWVYAREKIFTKKSLTMFNLVDMWCELTWLFCSTATFLHITIFT